MMQQPATGITVVPLTSQPPGITPAFGEVAHVTVQLQPTLNDIGDQVLTSPTDATPNQAQIDEEKKAVYKHPLFPLLSLIFERSEYAMHTCEPLSADTFAADIQSFVHKQEQDRKPFFSDDPDLDNLMIKAIQVLRIHLLELEKVNELCKDFCSRYIAVLKTKMQNHFQNENIFRPDYLPNALQEQLNAATPATPNPNLVVAATTSTASSSTSSIVVQPPAVSMATINQGQLVSGQTVYQMVQTPQGIVAQPIQIQTTPLPGQAVIQGNTPLGAIGANIVQTVDTNSNVTIAPATASQVSGQSEDEDDGTGKGKKNKRGVLPKHATNIMRSWLFQHIVHPYPTEDEKRQIAQQTNLTLLQVNNWFINARRRILQPMLDASNPDPTPKAKKPKTANTKPAVQRFWPESIAASIQEGVQNSLEAQPQQNTIQQIIIPTSAVVAVDGKIITAGTTLTGCDIIQQMQQQVAAASNATTSIVIPSVKGTTPVPIAPKVEIKPERPSVDGDADADSGDPDADMLSLDCDSAGEEMSNS